MANESIKIWATGVLTKIAERAIELYQEYVGTDVSFVVEEFTPQEMFDLLNFYNENIINNYEPIDALPNLILMYDQNIKKFLKNYNIPLVALDDWLDTSVYMPCKITNITHDNHLYGVPCTNEPVALYYNKELLMEIRGEEELKENITWDEFIEIGHLLKNFGVYLLPPATYLAQILMQSKGCLYYDLNGFISADGSRETMELIQLLNKEGLLYPDSTLPNEMLYDLMGNGTIFSVIGAPYYFSAIKQLVQEKGLDQTWGLTKIPKSDSFQYDVDLGGYSWLVLNKNDPEIQQVAIDFLLQIFNQESDFSREMSREMAEKYDLVPAINYAWDILDSLTNNGCFVDKQVILYLLEISVNVPEIYYGKYTGDLTENLNGVILDIFEGRLSFERGCSNFEDTCKEYSELDPPPLPPVIRIEIEQAPEKTDYYKYECFSNYGMIVRAYFVGGIDAEIKGYEWDPDILGLDDKFVTIRFSSGGSTAYAFQRITVSNRKLTSLTVFAKHTFLHYDSITPDSFYVTAKYDKGTPRYVTASDVFPTVLSSVGETEVDVFYREDGDEIKETLSITVYKKLQNLSIINQPKKLSYYKGESFCRSGMKALAHYSDGTQAIISAGSLKVTPEVVKFKNGQDTATLTISYTEMGVTEQTSVTVYKKTGTDLEDCDITQDMANSGMGTLNLSTGKFIYKFDDFAGNDSIIPICVSHVYKDGIGDSFCMGTNWRLNLQQELDMTDGKWRYTDKEGKEFLFDNGYDAQENRSSIRNEKLGLDLFEDAKNHNIELIDRNNNTLVFAYINKKYRLIAMHMFPSTPDSPIDAYLLEIAYLNDGKISTVTAGKSVGGQRPMVQFEYLNDRLAELKYQLSEQTIVAKYSYNNGELSTITLLNANTKDAFARSTKFKYEEKGFSVYDLSSNDGNGNNKSLQYSLDSLYRVKKYTIGYGESEQDETTISYSATEISAEENTDISLSTVIENNGTVKIFSFNSMGVASQYSYDITEASHTTPKKIYSAQSRGFSYKSLSEKYSDTLDVFHDDFENGTDDWSLATKDSQRAISGKYSISGTLLRKTYKLTSNDIANDTTLYLSLWASIIGSGSDLIIKIMVDGSESGQLTHKLDKKLDGKWQFTAFCLGKRKIGDKITVQVSSKNTIFLDDVRLTKSPYETPEDIADTAYDSFGNVTKSYQYNPIDKGVEITETVYNAEHQITEQTTLTAGKTQKNKIVKTYDNGLLSYKQEYGGSGSDFTQEQCIYTDTVMTSSIDVNNTVTKYADGKDYTETTIVGEANSPEMKQKEERFPNSSTVKTLSLGDLQNCYFYLENGNLQKAQFNYSSSVYKSEFAFEYDTFGNMSVLKIGTVALVTMEYDYKHMNKTTYANGDQISYKYDAKDRVIAFYENETEIVSVRYSDDAEDLMTITHSNNLQYTCRAVNKKGITNEYCARFSDSGRLLRVVEYAANGTGNVTSVGYFIDNSETPFEKCTTTKDGNGNLTKIERSYHGANTSYVYDSLYRLSGKTTTYTSSSRSKQFKTNYYYNAFTGNRKGTRITKEEHYNGTSKTKSYDYDYYKNGNLKKIRMNSDAQSEYVYDKYGRLVEEYNYNLSRAYKFTYDNGGNITKKETYLITGGVTSTSPFKTDIYNYESTTPGCGQNPDWKDQLKSYNGTSIQYDALGNPLNYLGKDMTWRSRRLIAIDGVAMDYDHNGLRVKKGNRTYYWQNKTLIMERWTKDGTENYIYYYYDESGVCGMNYNGKEYYYLKNIFGDVIAVYDDLGNLQCSYAYDAWGNHKVYNASGSEIGPEVINVGNINPFRYRSYYWDTEFSLYYLQSRYYDPALGRFISADDVRYLDPESVAGFNLYAYCSNNPVMGTDPEGTWLIALLVSALIGAVVSAALSLYNEVKEKGWENVNVGKVIFDGLLGGIGGMAAASGLGTIAMMAVGAGLGLAQGLGDSILDGKSFADGDTWKNIVYSTIAGGLAFRIGGAGAKNVANLAEGFNKKVLRTTIEIGLKSGTNSAINSMIRKLLIKGLSKGELSTIILNFLNQYLILRQ